MSDYYPYEIWELRPPNPRLLFSHEDSTECLKVVAHNLEHGYEFKMGWLAIVNGPQVVLSGEDLIREGHSVRRQIEQANKRGSSYAPRK